MKRAQTAERTVRHVVALRCAESAVSDGRERRRLKRVARELRREIEVGVPKTQAAAVLAVSVTALDKWIGRGRLPVVRRPGSSRELRQHYLRTTSRDRLKETADLSRVLTSLATRGAAARERRTSSA